MANIKAAALEPTPPADLKAELLSAEERMRRGAVAPWGNASYLASEMGSSAPATPWRQNMPPSAFPCPVCGDAKGTVTATSHPTVPGSLTLVCSGSCPPAELRAHCRAAVPDAFVYRDDLLPPLPAEAIQALIARANDGSFTPGMQVPMRILDKLRAGTSHVLPYQYTSADRKPVVLSLRMQKDDGTKAIRNFFAQITISGALEIVCGLPAGPLPLFGLAELARRPEATILFVEGEKTAEAAQAWLTQMVVMTNIAGAENAHLSDFSPLAGKDIIICPDYDAAGGYHAKTVAAQALAAMARSVRIVRLPAGLPPKWDLADPLPEGVTEDDVRRAIDDAPAVTWDEVKDALRTAKGPAACPPFRMPDGHLARVRCVVDAVEEALSHIDPGCHRRAWWTVLAAIFHALGAEGLPMAVAWSARDNDKHGKFQAGEVERIFEAMALSPVPEPMSVVDLFWRAYRESKAVSADAKGWRAPADAMAEAEIAAFSSRHRKLVMGDNVFIAIQKKRADGSFEIERKSERTAESIYKAERVMDHAGKQMVSIYKLWEVGQRTPALDVVFRPGETVEPDQYNSFEGFAIEASESAGSFQLYMDLLHRICDENGDAERWLVSAFAYRVQNPHARMGSAVCLVGPQGSGKSTASLIIARILAPYSITLNEPARFVGRNNACLEGRLFVQSEEMSFGARSDWMNTLNHYVTSPIIDVEEKFRAQTQIENRMWIVMTANRNDVVRIAEDTRRFAMYRVSDPFCGDQAKRTAHYDALYAELDNGGMEALMHFLQTYQIPEAFDPKRVPRTPLYLELIGAAADSDPLRAWWREQLEKGALPGTQPGDQPWTAPIAKDLLYGGYRGFCEENGPTFRAKMLPKGQWAKELARMLPGGRLQDQRLRSDQGRVWHYVLPEYEACCAALEALHGGSIARAPQPAQLKSVM
jgi:hypothetical protein